MDLPQIDNYQAVFLDDIPLLDVRAPVEFEQGAFPRAHNVPLINDAERHEIGIRYKEMGQDQAIELGHELVSGATKQVRIEQWIAFTRQHPQGALYCFRGGMRSKISQQWIFEHTGVQYPRIKGGYKALRRFLLQELEQAAQQIQPFVLGGRTGVGKTLLLRRIRHSLDLEAIYRHRGSAFGRHVVPQPGQIDIENTLAIALLKLRNQQIDKLVVEDEAPNIGSRSVPRSLLHAMQQAPLVLLEAPLEERVDIVFAEYIPQALAEHQQLLGEEQGFTSWAGQLQNALEKIQRRLGGQRYQALKTILDDALHRQQADGSQQHHKDWIRVLLRDYYDPMYDYQLGKKAERIVFRGEPDAVRDYLETQHGIV